MKIQLLRGSKQSNYEIVFVTAITAFENNFAFDTLINFK